VTDGRETGLQGGDLFGEGVDDASVLNTGAESDCDGVVKDGIKASAEAVAEQAAEHILEFLPYGSSYLHLEELEKKGVTTTRG